MTTPNPERVADITITFSVDNVDPTLVDPRELADFLLDLAAEYVRRNGPDSRWGDLATDHMSAEWGAS